MSVTIGAPRDSLPQPTGFVSLFVDGSQVARLRLDHHGHASFVARGLHEGAHTITAKYSGDQNYF